MISEIRMSTLGVADLERAVAFYRDGFGMIELGRAPLDPAWGGPAGTEVAILAADERRVSVLRLLRPARPETCWTDGRAVYDLGHYALNYHARDVEALLPRLKEHGMRAAPWIDGEVTTTRWDLAHATVVDSMFRDPDGALIDTFTLLKGAEAHEPFEGDVSGLECMAIQVADMARSRAFYEGFGYEPLYDHMVDPPPFLGYGEGTRVHNVNLRMRDRKPGRVELVQHYRADGARGASPRGLAELPRLGILSVGFETTDLPAAGETLVALGAEPDGPERRAALPGLGETHVRAYSGPDGERLELFHLTERDSSWPV